MRQGQALDPLVVPVARPPVLLPEPSPAPGPTGPAERTRAEGKFLFRGEQKLTLTLKWEK